MKAVAFYNLKGGSGKTTLACLFADYLINSFPNKKVAIIDCDKQQQSSRLWADFNYSSNLKSYLLSGSNKFTLKQDFNFLQADYILIDSPPAIGENVKSILSLSNDIVIPIPPSQIGLSSFLQENNLKMLVELKETKPNLNFHIVFNMVKYHENKIASQAKELLENNEYVKKLFVKNWFKLGNRSAFIINFNKKNHLFNTSDFKAKREAKYLISEVLEEII